MATPVADAYSAPLGRPIKAGRYGVSPAGIAKVGGVGTPGVSTPTGVIRTITATGIARITAFGLGTVANNAPPPVLNGIYEPPITGEVQPGDWQYRVYDADGGVLPRYSSKLQYIEWRNPNVGDWIDANLVAQGATMFGQTVNSSIAGQRNTLSMPSLAQRLITNNTGIYLRYIGAFGILGYGGRSSANPPLLTIVTNTGTYNCPCVSSAWWTTSSPGSHQAGNIEARFGAGGGTDSVAQFDLTGVSGTVSSATLSLYITLVSGQGFRFGVFQANPKSFMIGSGAYEPQLGLAAEVGEAALESHPDVLMAGDFAGTTFIGAKVVIPKLFRAGVADNTLQSSVIPDVHAPGTIAYRGSFQPMPSGDATNTNRGGFSGTEILQLGDITKPFFPTTGPPSDDLYYRMYLMIEEDWVDVPDGNKMGITWDCRMGYWNSGGVNGGYWQNQSGNGGSTGSGKKELWNIPNIGQRYVYLGQMLRMETGNETDTDNPLLEVKPWLGYNYDIPLWEAYPNGGFPPGIAYGGAGSGPNGKETKFRRGRWYCIEQHLRLNTIDLTNADALGNGVARPDGLLETWINGVLVDQRFDLRLRAHPEMGIAQINANWYYGGVQGLDHPIHYRMNHFCLAKRYIGPRVRASTWPFTIPAPGTIASLGGNTLMNVTTDGAVSIDDPGKSLHLTKVLGSWGSSAVTIIKTGGGVVTDVWYYIMGGGHGDSGFDGLLRWKASTNAFEELLPTTKWAPAACPDPTHGEITFGRPDSCHIYDDMHDLSTGDSPLGTGLFHVRCSAVGQGAGIGRQSHFHSSVTGWSRVGGLQTMAAGNFEPGMVMKDTLRKRFVMYLSTSTSGAYMMLQYDVAAPDWTVHSGAGATGANWNSTAYAHGVYDPVRDLLIAGTTFVGVNGASGLHRAKPAGAPGNAWTLLNMTGDIIPACVPGQTLTTGPGDPMGMFDPDARGWGNGWMHRSAKDTFIVMNDQPYLGYYEITPPSNPAQWATAPWVWVFHPMTTGASNVSNYAGFSIIGRRFQYVAEWDALIVCPTPTHPMEIWKLL